MQDKVTFEYAIIRVVPKVERDEFFNVGVMVYSKRKKFLGVKYYTDAKKLAAFSCELSLDQLNEYLKAWIYISEGAMQGGKIGTLELSDRFRWLAANRSTIIQSSKTHSGLCFEPKDVLEELFATYVL